MKTYKTLGALFAVTWCVLAGAFAACHTPVPEEDAGTVSAVPPTAESFPIATPDQVKSCSGPDGKWFCSRLRKPVTLAAGTIPGTTIQPSWTVTAWAIDGLNTTGCASDSNDGTHQSCSGSQGPLLTWYGLVNRWGTIRPTLNQDTTVTFMSGQNLLSGPSQCIVFEPTPGWVPPGSAGPSINLVGTLTNATQPDGGSFSGTLASTTAKNRATNTILHSTLGIISLTAPQMIVNTTRSNSIAWLYTKNAGTNWNLSQPYNPIAVPSGGNFSAPVENNAWANTDAYQAKSLPQVCVSKVFPTNAATGELTNVNLMHLLIVEDNLRDGGTVQPGDDPLLIGPGVNIVESQVQREVNQQQIGIGSQQSNVVNNALQGGLVGGVPQYGPQTSTQSVAVQGGTITPGQGSIGTGDFSSVGLNLGGDLILTSGAATAIAMNDYNSMGSVFLDGITLFNLGTLDMGVSHSDTVAGANVLYGSGTLDTTGPVIYPSGATAGATAFPLSGGLKLMGQQKACLDNPSATLTTLTCNISIASGANLDTNLGTTVSGCMRAGPGHFCNIGP